MAADIEKIKALREATKAPLADIRQALEKSGGNLEKAVVYLRSLGKIKAEKKAERETKAGLIEAYIHAGARVGTLLELRCETDFVAKNEEFKKLAHELAMQIAAMAPGYISSDKIPLEVLDEEKKIYLEEAQKTGKAKDLVDKIVEGRMKKRFAEICLLDQPYIKNQDITVKDLIHEYIGKIGENIEVTKFVRFEI